MAPQGPSSAEDGAAAPRPAARPWWRRRRGIVGLAAALLLGAFSVWRRRQGRPLIQPPYCAWRFLSNFRSYNVAFPDAKSIYHVSLMHLGPGDEIRISSDSLPYARYFSFQSYDIPNFVASASLRDVDLVAEHGPNCYSNLTAAVSGEKQGGYTLYITAHGDRGYLNELRALADGQDAGYFVLFLRIYQDHDADGRAPHPDIDPSACFGPAGLHQGETPQEWGWACPPTVALKRGGASADFKPLPICRYRRKFGIRYNDVTKPVQECPHEPNTHFSFFLPSPYYLQGKFGNRDAKYLFSCAIQPSKLPVTEPSPLPLSDVPGEQQQEQLQQQQQPPAGVDAKRGKKEVELELWSRVSGVLPRTANSLYRPPYISNITDYEVRYVSVSSVGRSLPYRGYQTLNDKMIAGHYLESVGPEWNRSFVVWLGPPGAAGQLPPQVEEEHGIFMPWGSSFGGRQIPFPGVLYRQIVSRGQMVGGDGGDAGPHHSGLAEIIPQTCAAGEEPSSVCREDLHCWLEKELCCGRAAPEWCFLPRYVAAKMQNYYPRIEYFVRPTGSARRLERIGGDADGEGALRPLVQEGPPTSSQSGAEGATGSLASKLWDFFNVALWF